MRVAILSCGAIVVRNKDLSWLFGAPTNVKEALDASGIDVPPFVFTTSLRSPGYSQLGAITRFKELPLNMDGLSAVPVQHKHGTDYVIEDGQSKILFSERGDVSVEDVASYDLAIIKNKHRSDKFSDAIVTWPWPDTEFSIQDHVVTPFQQDTRLKIWSSMEDVPNNLKKIDDTPLTLEQANFLARVAKGSGEGGEENWAIAHSTFKKVYKKDGDSWVKKEKTAQKDMDEEKLGQDKAGYDPKGGEGIRACGNCEYYCKNMTCCKVEGNIAPGGVCALWEYGFEEEEEEMPHAEMPEPAEESILAYMEDKEPEAAPPESADKEFDGDRPIPRIIDIITAALHKAYNDTSDKLFQVGYLSQDERMVVAKSIGEGLTAFRAAIESEPFAERAVDKWDADQLMTKEVWTHVYKTKDDQWRWAAITSVATWDRQGEFLTTKAMDWAITFNKMRAKLHGTKDRGPLRYKHIPGLDGGRCDTQLRIGDYLFESGTFDDTPIGLAMRNKFKDGSGVWQISPGLAFAKNDLVNGRYKRAAIFERSMTQRPANPFTIILHKSEDSEMKILTETELKQAATELGMEYEEIKMMYERALATGSGPIGLKEFTEIVVKATGTNASGFPGGANSTHNDEDEATMLKDAIGELDEEELKHLAELVGESYKEKGKMPPWLEKGDGKKDDMEDDEEESTAKKPVKKTKETDRVDQLEQLILQQGQLLAQQTKAMGELAQALTGQGTQQRVEEAVAGVLGQMPRRQAAGFASSVRTKETELTDDNQIMQQLKAIQDQLATQANPGKQVYNAFTSTRLNQRRGVR